MKGSPPARRTFASRRVTRWALVLLVVAAVAGGVADHARHGEAERSPRPAPSTSASPTPGG